MQATKATANIIKYQQPDGSTLLIKVYGDEFCGYFRTLDGYIVSKGQDGYLYYAHYNTGSLQLTSVRASSASARTKSMPGIEGMAVNIPPQVMAALRDNAANTLNPSSRRQRVLYNASHAVVSQAETESKTTAIPLRSLVLLVEFADTTFTINGVQSYFRSLLNDKNYTANGATGSAADYFHANFSGRYDFIFDVSDIITLTRNQAYYGGRTASLNDANPAAMVMEACEVAAQNGVDFSVYDSDNDGYIDNVAIIFAGCNEAEGGDPSALWPHKGNLSEKNVTVNGLKLGNYTCSSEYTGAGESKYPASIGTFCHEFAHSLGLPDLYDVNGNEEGDSPALYGALSLMDAGNYSNGGKTPPYFTSIEREILSLHEVEELEVEKFYTLLPVQNNGKLYRIPTRNEGEYFLLECRQASGWDAFIGGSGLLVYHIDKSMAVHGGIPASRRWELNVINSYAPHECAKILAAAPDRTSPQALSYLFYPGASSNTSLTPTGIPKWVDWQQYTLGMALENIIYAGGEVTFNTHEELSYDATLPKIEQYTVTPYQDQAFIQWKTPDGTDCSQGEWHINWEVKDKVNEIFSVQTRNLHQVLENLLPKTEYTGTAYFVKENKMGDMISFSFVTDAISSSYPYLKISGNYRVNDVVYLLLQNLTEEYVSVKFKINEAELSDSYYQFLSTGKYLIEALISYPDGSCDIINKTVTVQ